jgi:predicted transcriptional regulator
VNRVSAVLLVSGSTRAGSVNTAVLRTVREVMGDPFPVVDASTPTDRLSALLAGEAPAAVVQKDGKLIGIVSRHDVLQQLIGTR